MSTLNWKVWVMGGLAVLVLALMAYAKYLNTEIDGYRTAVSTYQSAQATNLESISALEISARKLASQDAENRAKSADAAARNKRMFDALKEELDKRKSVREKVYVLDKSAGAWADGIVPPSVADSLR